MIVQLFQGGALLVLTVAAHGRMFAACIRRLRLGRDIETRSFFADTWLPVSIEGLTGLLMSAWSGGLFFFAVSRMYFPPTSQR